VKKIIAEGDRMAKLNSSTVTTYSDSSQSFARAIPDLGITEERLPFIQHEDEQRIKHTGTARANIAASYQKPDGTTESNWAARNQHRTVLQQHCLFFDSDDDGVIWPQDTYIGFYRLGYGMILSLIAVFIIHSNFSYPTLSSYLPDPFFRIYTRNIHKDKHGSDTGSYDTEGRFIPQKFEDMFSKYAHGRDYMTISDVFNLMKGQRCIADPIGWGGAMFEWLATYIMLWPEDGKMWKEDIRRIYDGSIFFTIAKRRAEKDAAHNVKD